MAMQRVRGIIGMAWLLGMGLFPWLVMGPLGGRFEVEARRILGFLIVAVGGALLLKAIQSQRGWGEALCLTALIYGVAYKLACFIPDVSTYPLSLGWSEASRYYYASLYLSDQVYGLHAPPSVLHPTRYLMQAAPFLIPHAPLWLHRLWQVILWIVTTGGTSILLARRLFLTPGLLAARRSATGYWSLALFSFLFLFQGPVYYHLLVIVILILWGVDVRRPWRTLGVVMLASLWAGISRINWVPMPGLLAATLYLLETRLGQTENRRDPFHPLHTAVTYLSAPIYWVASGTAVGYAAQKAYEAFSGNPPGHFGSALTSDLLWYRLLPNPTYPLGILPGALLVSLPLGLLIVWYVVAHRRQIHWLRSLGLAAILAVALAGGVVVSVKIGGGSNLHNLDAYLVLLLVVGGYVYCDRFSPESCEIPTSPKAWWLRALAALALIPPLYLTVTAGGRLPAYNPTEAAAAIQSIQQAVAQATQNGGEVLFIRERQLLAFGEITGVQLVPDYELVFLMEMAMANNAAYLEAFHADLARQRFALIVAEEFKIQYQGRWRQFGEENDAWVKQVSEPVLCYYAPLTSPIAGIWLYTPRANACR